MYYSKVQMILTGLDEIILDYGKIAKANKETDMNFKQ